MNKNLSTTFCGFKLENPFCLASGPVANNYEMCARALKLGWAGVFFKTITLFKSEEVSPRFDCEGKDGWTAFKNMEQLSEVSAEENFQALARLKKEFPNKLICASIMGQNDEEWTHLAKMATEARVDMIECNFSCPQTTLEHTGSDVGTNPQLVAEYLKATRKGTSLPIIAKMTPNITNMNIIAKVAMQSGANAISAINTVKSIINLDLNDFTTLPDINGKSSVSGMSGRAIKPIALRFQYEMYNDPQLKALKTEYSGVGGIDDAKDVMEYILLGASCVQVCTSVMERGYTIIEKLLTDLAGLVGANQIKDLIGKACPNIVSPKELDRATKCIFKIGNECKRCDRCFTSCNDGGHQAIVKTANDYKIDTTKCVGCGLCSLVCPNRNIKMIERVKK